MRLNDFQIAKNFNLMELQCPCCHRVMTHPRLVAALQSLRDLLERPMVITSGYRCAEHNRTVGGASASRHMKGLAADVSVPKELQPELCDMARRAGFSRAISYPARSFVHLEVGYE
ncbi:MAG: D-Ala-D-Ala carboxypeptidase family metallohydrolase [Cloacibacillus sp.]